MREHPKYGEGLESGSAITGVVSVRMQRNTRLVLLMAADVSGGLDQTVTRYRYMVRVADCSAPTFLPPLAPRPLRRLNAPMEALTPVRFALAHRSPCFTHATFLTIPSPTTLCSPVVALTRYVLSLSATDLPRVFQRSSRAYFPHGSRLRHRIAGSPETPGRIGFVILRTGRSPPVALHPSSRRRSYSRLQAVA